MRNRIGDGVDGGQAEVNKLSIMRDKWADSANYDNGIYVEHCSGVENGRV